MSNQEETKARFAEMFERFAGNLPSARLITHSYDSGALLTIAVFKGAVLGIAFYSDGTYYAIITDLEENSIAISNGDRERATEALDLLTKAATAAIFVTAKDV